MKSILLSLATLCLVISAVGFTGTHKAGRVTHSIYHGYLVDQMCSGDMTEKGIGAFAAAAKHTQACLVEPQCVKSGYGIVTSDNSWIPFDKAGSQKAGQLAILSLKKDHIMVEAEGIMSKGTLRVDSLKEE